MRVLIADDDPVSRLVLKMAVERFGHECLEVEDGEKAWKLFQSTPEVDVLISDWMMPGLNGLELCRKVRQANRPEYTYFIFLTVLEDKKHLLEGMQAGADDYLGKPLDHEQLRVRLIAATRVTSLDRELRREIAGRKQIEKELQTSEERFRNLTNATFEGIAIIEQGKILEANRAFASMFGYESSSEVIGKSVLNFVSPEFRDSVQRNISSEAEGACETVGLKRDGTTFDIEIHVKTSSYQGRLVDVTALRDITERKEAQREIREAETRYRTLVENIPAVTYIQEVVEPGSTQTSPTMYASPQIEAQSGYPPEAFVEDPKLWIKLLHPADRERVLAEDARTDETGEPFKMEYRQITRNGRVLWIRDDAVLVRNEEGRPRFWQGIQLDITEQKRAEQALRESELRLRTVITNVPVVLFVLDRAGVFKLSEGKGLALLGLEPGKVIGRSISELYGGSPEILADVDRALAGEAFSAVREFGSRTFETWYSPLRASTGELSGVISVAADVTERRQVEERLREANRHLEELAVLRADFTAMVAHEIGSPLATIRGFLDVLATGELGSADQADVYAKIMAETERLSTLVADVRSAAAIEHGGFTIVPWRTSVDELFEDVASFAETLAGDHALIIEVETEERVRADPHRIGQVLRNLLSNAAKYSPDGTPIELRAFPSEAPGRVRIEVTDRGYGVHPDDVDRIFEKFGRGRDSSGRKKYGVGLGLYLSRRILQAHGSELTFRPASGGGSVFGFELETSP